MHNLFDNHSHSQFSFDGGKTTVMASAVSAREKGLSGICFTDHCDFYVPPMKAAFEHLVPETFDVKAQQDEIDRVNRETGSKGFRVFKGVEIGLQKNSREKIREFLSENSFDGIIASVHYLDETDPFFGGYYQGKDWKTAYGHYLETLYEEMKWLGDFDIMGHYDYVARYAPYPQESIFYNDFSDIFDEILKYLAENGKALEINTKTYQDYKGRTPVLDKNILLRFREFGGEAISLGSDSHDPVRPGDKFERYAGFIRNAGFRFIAHFENRRLCMTPIQA
ncbi:MAG: histidinol-phosphatase HisJ family protein [Bacteroidetes bacterium]|uniref:Histidinol-phosphatase n=1 Tax=Candidatus Cryptobacteroides excrementavium TaxID=2840759 RepID=A0A9D9J242_9BACT|nr:histidinol-phosphatase HisJ family protein [Candidatus Cryptobacteroides excrementavium]